MGILSDEPTCPVPNRPLLLVAGWLACRTASAWWRADDGDKLRADDDEDDPSRVML